MNLAILGYSLGTLPAWVPTWVVPVAILHLVLAAVLLIPAWVALARAHAFGPLALVLVVPVLGLLYLALRMMGRVLPWAQWSSVWGLLILIPGINIFFLWVFAFAPWRRRYLPDEDEEEVEPEPEAATGGRQKAAREPRRAPAPAAAPQEPPAPEPPPRSAPPTPAPPVPPSAPKLGGLRTLEINPTSPDAEAERDLATVRVSGDGRSWRLTAANEAAGALAFTLEENVLRESDAGLLLGRSARAHVVIDHESISRNHARFALVEDGLLVEDLDSMNGTWVDGRKLEANRPVPLRPGSVVEFGKLRFSLEDR